LAFERISQLYPVAKGSQLEIADWLLSLILEPADSGSGRSKDEALQTLRSLSLSTEVLVHLVEALPKAADLQEHPQAKKRRTSSNDPGRHQEIDHAKVQSAIRHITLVLELIESSNPETHPQLLRGLFHTLSELHHFKTLLGSELVYTFQILLGCILAVVDGLRTNPGVEVDRTVVRTDLIVECVRTTSSIQIHNTALLLVSSLASWAPELVLHCVMPLFTFMSSTLLRQSDSFSAHVTDKTVERIVPPLAASLKTKGKVLVVGASELLLSFTAAFEHIPLHRRAGLFKHLVETLGPEETLFAVIAMLVERYGSESNVSSFVADLANQFSAFVTIRATKQYLDLISDTLKPKRNLSDVLLSFGDKDVAEIVESQETLLDGLATLLRNTTVRERLAAELTRDTEDSRAIRTTFASLLEHTMQMTRDLATNASLESPANALQLSVLGLMPTKDFIESSAQLMQTGTDQTRQQVFCALEARVSEAKAGDTATRQIFLDVLSNCGVFLRDDQPVATRHAAVSCIDQICERYGKTDRSAVLEVAKQVAGNFALGSDDLSLQIISILCLASMVEVLGDDCIPILPNVLTCVLAYLEADVEEYRTVAQGEPNMQLQAAGYALLNGILDHMPWMLAARHLDQALLLADNAAFVTPPVHGLQEFGKLVAKKIGAPQLFASIHRTFNSIPSDGAWNKEGMRYHLGIFREAIQSHDKATVTKNARVIFSILYEAFDLRRKLHTLKEDEHQGSDMFNLVDRIALDVTLKLNDATFRPFFLTLVEWATKKSAELPTEGPMTLRLISLYSFSLTLFEQLKSIVTGYAGFLLENASDILKKPPMDTPWDLELIDLVVQTLSSSFNHDQDEFWQTPAHFEAVAMPLIEQVQRPNASQLTEQIIATITDLAAAARSHEHLKAMNAAIMAQLRSGDAAVRLAAVQCQRSLTERLAVDWLDLLPEMLPIISELHEDDNEDVERETLRWAKEIEEITGESLDPMLA
jgi:U3 small nucleolar RNA-associated protein 10